MISDIICHSRGGLVARASRDLTETQLREGFEFDAKRGKYEADLEAWGQAWHIRDGVQIFVFGQERNDLVVPTTGVSQWPGGSFQQVRRLPFSADRSVHHSSLFLQEEARRQLWEWLTA